MNGRVERAFAASLWRTTGVIAAALLLGLLVGGLAWWLFAATAALLAHSLIQLRRYGSWLQGGSRRAAVDDSGIWGTLYRIPVLRQRRELARRRRLVQLLRAFRTTAAALPDATVVLDDSGAILWFNAAATRLLGLSYPQDLGGHFSNLVRSPRVTRWLESGDWSEALMDVPAPADRPVTAISLGLWVMLLIWKLKTMRSRIASEYGWMK